MAFRRVAFSIIAVLLMSGVPCFPWSFVRTHGNLTEISLSKLAGSQIAYEISVNADTPDFYHKFCPPFEAPCLHGHRITEFLGPDDGRFQGGPGAEVGVAYWTQKAREAYLQRKHWTDYLGWATHYLADALCPPHCPHPGNPEFWKEKVWLKGKLLSRDLAFESFFDLPGALKKYKQCLESPEAVVGVEYLLFPRDRREFEQRLTEWIIEKAKRVEKLNRQARAEAGCPYLPEQVLKEVFAWISVGIRSLYYYVNPPPVAVITIPGPAVLVESVVKLDGSASYDPDGEPLKYEWKIITRPSRSRARLSDAKRAISSFEPDQPGDYVLELTVSDVTGAKSRAQVTIRAVALGLVAGTSSPGKVYAHQGGSSWEPISSELGFAVLDIIVYNGALYAGVMSSSSRYESVGRLYRYDGGTNWTLVGDNLDNQVSCLVVYKGKLYIGTSWNGGRLYRYDGPGRCVLVVDHRAPGGWRGFRSAYVWGDYLYLGDIGYDIIGRYDESKSKFEHIVHLGGSCIYDFALYNNNLYAGAWLGSLYKSSNGTKWDKVIVEGLAIGSHLWELEVFRKTLFMGFDSGKLQSFDGKKVQTIWTAPTSIISMATDGNRLYLGTGGEAGYLGRTSGDGRVYVYDGKSVNPISDRLGVGVQVLYWVSSGAKTSPAEVNEIDEPLCPCSLTVKNVPNPIRDVQSTTFVAEGVDAELIRVEVYDLTGKLLWKGEGSGNELHWHTEDLSGVPLANGVYLYKVFVKVGEIWITSDVQKLVILR